MSTSPTHSARDSAREGLVMSACRPATFLCFRGDLLFGASSTDACRRRPATSFRTVVVGFGSPTRVNICRCINSTFPSRNEVSP